MFNIARILSPRRETGRGLFESAAAAFHSSHHRVAAMGAPSCDPPDPLVRHEREARLTRKKSECQKCPQLI
jgi:hypothetical protein